MHADIASRYGASLPYHMCLWPDDGSKSSYYKQLAADVGGGCGECGGSSGTQHPAPGTSSSTLLICHAKHSTEHLTYCLVTQGSFVKMIFSYLIHQEIQI